MGAPFGPKSHEWLVARVPDARLIPERDRSVLAFYFYMSVEIIISFSGEVVFRAARPKKRKDLGER